MFPLFPRLDENGRVRAAYDPRGWRMCPLVREAAHVRLTPAFVRRVREAGRLLLTDPDCARFLREVGEQLDALDRLLPLREERSPICRRRP